MTTKIAINWEPLPPLGLGIHPTVSRNLMKFIGEMARGVIDEETTELSIDGRGRRFKAYSPLYRRIRRAAGYPTKPDLTVTGAMMQAMTVLTVTPDYVTIGFLDASRPERASLVSQAWGRLRKKDRKAVWAMAMASKRRAGKAPRVRGRRSPSVKGRRAHPNAPASNHPAPLPSEKMRFTNVKRPWFNIIKGSKREKFIIETAQDAYAEAYLETLD